MIEKFYIKYFGPYSRYSALRHEEAEKINEIIKKD
jgi:hypothetical protein